jgi:predicted SprT family Zn-dependent metalloprotease
MRETPASGNARGDRLPGFLKARLEHWQKLWGIPELITRLHVRFSPRLRATWGRTLPARGTITLAESLATGPRERLEEVLCHEAAHVAVHMKYGRSARPHGHEWAAFVKAAGFAPVRALRAAVPSPPRVHPRALYEHRCTVCQSRRLARRPVPAWRCAECVSVGLAGAMTITRLSQGAALP